ncbi:MAG: hypothetical protein QW712_04540 [Candidatus Nitrosocaldus sp.]
MMVNADIYILEDPDITKCYKEIKKICKKICNGISITWHDYNNESFLNDVNREKHCDAAIDLNYSNKRLFIALEITASIHYCDEEDKLNNSIDFFYKKQVINNSTKRVSIVYYKRKPGKSEAEKGIKVGRNKIILMKCDDTLIQVLSDYNLI